MENFLDTIQYVQMILPALLDGAVATIRLFVLTLLLALPLGLPIALGSNASGHNFFTKFITLIIKAFCRGYVWIFRGTPLILQLYFFYFFLPITFQIRLDAFTTAVITFVLNYAAYFSEIFRAGIQSIDRGQHEAARCLGISKIRTMCGIIIPQAFRRVFPPIMNETITLVKDTALIGVITVTELMEAAKSAVNRDGTPTAYIVTAIAYLVITFVLTLVANLIEKRLSVSDAKED